MHRAMLLFASLAFTLSAVGLGALAPSTPTAQAQPPICINLPAGDHQFTAPARDREGEVTFQVTVGEGGVITAFTEPGGQPIPPAAMLDIFTGDDAYPLPEGVAFVECGAAQESMMEPAPGGGVCVNLPAGSYEETVSAGGRSYEITINVAEHGILSDVAIMGQTYGPSEAIALLEGFGAALPAGIQIVDCPEHDSAMPTGYANTGTGGLADPNAQGGSGIWYGIGALAVLALTAAIAWRRRAAVETASRV